MPTLNPYRSQVEATTTPTTLVAARKLRTSVSIYNHTTATDLYIAIGAGGSSTDFTVLLKPEGLYEVQLPYGGVITGVFTADVVGEYAMITETAVA